MFHKTLHLLTATALAFAMAAPVAHAAPGEVTVVAQASP